MEWNFFTVSAVASGIVLVLSSLAGSSIGTASQRMGYACFGGFSIAYGIWVAKQNSGIYFFSVAPLGLALVIVVRAIQRVVDPKTRTTTPTPQAVVPARSVPVTANGTGGAKAGISQSPAQNLRNMQPQRIRDAVARQSEAFNPGFAFLEASPGTSVYQRNQLGLEWSIDSDEPILANSETVLATWHGTAGLKVAVGKELQPSEPLANVTWITIFEGPGSIVLTRSRLVGMVRAGETMSELIGQHEGQAIVLWNFDLSRCSSVTAEQIGPTSAVVVSSEKPAGHLTLTNLNSAGASDRLFIQPNEAAAQIEVVRQAEIGLEGSRDMDKLSAHRRMDRPVQFCTSCGEGLDESHRFCDGCGTPVEAMT